MPPRFRGQLHSHVWCYHRLLVFDHRTCHETLVETEAAGMIEPPNQITAHNAGWRSQFRFAGSVSWPGVCEFHRWADSRT